MSSTKEFGTLRALFWPVHKEELKRFVPMLVIFFLICFNYSILRASKDALVVTAPSSGAEAIPFIKVWAILPMALLMTLIFTRLSNRFSREKVFYFMMSIFLGFFFIFAFVLYPFRDSLHPHEMADRLQEILPLGFKGLIAIFRNWTFTAFYIMSEMWSTMIMTVLFWGFANDVSSVKDAKRLYGLLGVAANLSTILSGQVSTVISRAAFDFPLLSFFGTDSWSQAVLFLNCIVIGAGILCIVLFKWLHLKGLGYNSQHIPTGEPTIKMGLRKNFAYLAKSKYLICIAIIVVMYNIAINLVEVVWKNQVKELYPSASDFSAYMGQVLTAIGVVATLTAIFISGNLIRRFSWTTTAMISPVIILFTSIGFFTFLLFKESSFSMWIAGFFTTSPLVIGVFFGSLQNCLARASKYTVFDATKELAFIPLSQESKLKGKSAIDGVGSRVGKSGGSLIHQSLLMVFGTVSLSTPYVAVILMGAIGAWIVAVRSLGRQFNQLVTQNETVKVDETPADSMEPALAMGKTVN